MLLLGDGEDSSEFESINGSDEEEGKVRYPQFAELDLKHEVVFKLGMKFATANLFRKAVREYSIQRGKEIFLDVNCSAKIYGICRNKMNGNHTCPWVIYCAKMRDESTFQIRTFHDNHTCSRTQINSNCTPNYIAERFKEDIRENPTWDVHAFHRHVIRKTQCIVTLAKAHKSFNLAKLNMQGSSADQYLKLWDYIAELKRTNPGSSFLLKVKNRPNQTAPYVFRGIYICWGALKRGFLEGCRPVIGVDGCHLSGPHKWVLLTVVAIDPNNCMYPFAYAVVGQEKKSTWRWFLRLLSKDLNIESPKDYTFISDKQKGLILAMEEVLPGVEHRFCVRHLYNNFKGVHKGLVLKNILWKCARASTLAYFNNALEEMKAIDEAAYQWLASKPGQNWSRSHFSFQPKSDILLNNLCESFNACIKHARGKPILSMLEDIRKYLMDLSMRKLEAMRKKTEAYLCPKVQIKIEELKGRSHEYIVDFNEQFWHAAIASADGLYDSIQGEEITQTSRLVSSQPVGAVGIKKAQKAVRRSQRILESPKKGPITVDFADLTKANVEGSDIHHAGILRSKGQAAKLPKGHLMKGGKRYISLAAMKAEMEHNKKKKLE